MTTTHHIGLMVFVFWLVVLYGEGGGATFGWAPETTVCFGGFELTLSSGVGVFHVIFGDSPASTLPAKSSS